MSKKRIRLLLSAIIFPLLLSSCSSGAKKVKVSFDWNFKTEQAEPETKKVIIGEPYGTLPTPSFAREGYSFSGWNPRDDGRGSNVTEDTIVEKKNDHTLYAVWAGNQYTVSFDLNGGNINGVTTLASRTVTYGNMYGAMVIPDDPEKKLASFLGWFLNKEGTGTPITFSTKVETLGDHTLYAVFKDVRTKYTFENEDELEDFYDVNSALTMKVENNQLELSNSSDNPRAYLNIENKLRAGSTVDFDVEFIGSADKENQVRSAFFAYGIDGNGKIINKGNLMDPEKSEETRKQVRWWYWGQGSNNLTDGAGDITPWNDGHLVYTMNILEDCAGIGLMIEFGRKAIDSEFDTNKTLWENNKWIIHSVTLHHADYEFIKDEYDFSEEGDINAFVNPKNINYEIDETDQTLKISKGEIAEEKSYLELETHYLPKGARVEVDIAFYGDTTYSSMGRIGVFSYGNYPDGTILNNRKPDDTIPSTSTDPVYATDWFYGAYGTTNESWAKIKLENGVPVSFTNFVYEDSFGITFMFEFGNVGDGYFKISNIRITRQEYIISEYDFAKSNQLNDFMYLRNCEIAIDEDDYGNYLKVNKASDGHAYLTLQTLLLVGASVEIEIEYISETTTYSGADSQFTFLTYYSQYGGKNLSTDPVSVIGNASWDEGWDGNKYTMSFEVNEDCYGINFEFVFNSDANAYYKIRSVIFY